MNIWIDLASPPQVLFFKPILDEFARRGIITYVTTREYSQTIQLASRLGIPHEVIGHHGGTSLSGLGISLAKRAYQLRSWVSTKHIDLAVSHNSYAQACASKSKGIPFATIMDFEHQPLNHIAFRLADRVIVPEVFPEAMLKKWGARGKTYKYKGVKEQVYLSDFTSNGNSFKPSEGIHEEQLLVVVRPPASWTAYHRFENTLFETCINSLSKQEDLYILLLPRTEGQREALNLESSEALNIAQKTYDGPDLIYHADAVISAGGSMNREAAVLGTPAYSIFLGKESAVDRYLSEMGRLTFIRSLEDVEMLHIDRNSHRKPILRDTDLVKDISDMIIGTLANG